MLRGLFIPLWCLLAATELTTTAFCRSLLVEQADTGNGYHASAHIDGGGSKEVKTHSYRSAATGLILDKRIMKEERAHPLETHDVIFVIKQRNMDELTRILHDISDPQSVNYGQHMSAAEIADLTRNPGSRSSVVKHLKSSGASIVSETSYGEYITARASIQVWEEMFNTVFYTYALQPSESDYGQPSDKSGVKRFVRAEEYSVPMVLDKHVTSVLNTVQMIHVHYQRLPILESMSSVANTAFDGSVYPAILNEAYNIDSNIGHPRATQAVYESLDQFFSPNDLTAFQERYGLPLIPVNQSIGDHSSDSHCIANWYDCVEPSLDIQYITAISQSPTTNYYMPDASIFADFLTELANTINPPLVVSISYNRYESGTDISELEAFNVQAIKLSAMGVTIVTSSGDDGVSGFKTTDSSQCAYQPNYMSTNPYVLSIGGTRVCLRSECACND